ncbi:MAG TPA: flagellar filament capping protein FliD [Azonexus sp.]
MAPKTILDTGFDFSRLQSNRSERAAPSAAAGGDFLAQLQARVADFKSQALGTLISTAMNDNGGHGVSDFAALLGAGHSAGNPVAALLADSGAAGALPAAGYNTTLFDPQSAYRMMTEINRRDVSYRAEFAEMTDLGAYVTTMQQAAQPLAGIDATTPPAEIRQRLQDFVATYNGWIDRFDEELAAGGLLAGTHAATASQWELEQSVESIFNGAGSGVRGMGALGLTIDPVSNMASLDTARLDAVLAGNPDGALAAIREFSGNFAKSAQLLNSAGNFIPNRMANLSRVIDYLDQNMSALQVEFGTGDAARPSGDVARALAAYNAMRGERS